MKEREKEGSEVRWFRWAPGAWIVARAECCRIEYLAMVNPYGSRYEGRTKLDTLFSRVSYLYCGEIFLLHAEVGSAVVFIIKWLLG
jgi:hypothetical protein